MFLGCLTFIVLESVYWCIYFTFYVTLVSGEEVLNRCVALCSVLAIMLTVMVMVMSIGSSDECIFDTSCISTAL